MDNSVRREKIINPPREINRSTIITSWCCSSKWWREDNISSKLLLSCRVTLSWFLLLFLSYLIFDLSEGFCFQTIKFSLFAGVPGVGWKEERRGKMNNKKETKFGLTSLCTLLILGNFINGCHGTVKAFLGGACGTWHARGLGRT